MAKLVTVVQTYFMDDYTYRNNRVEIQIPDEAAELIRKFWNEKGIHNCATAKYLASNQCAIADLFQDEKLLGGISEMLCDEEKVENEIFEHRFADDEEDDRD